MTGRAGVILSLVPGCGHPTQAQAEARAQDDYTRLSRTLCQLPPAQLRELVDVQRHIKDVTAGDPPLVAAFACLAIAELRLLEAADQRSVDPILMAHLRSYALDVAAGLGTPRPPAA